LDVPRILRFILIIEIFFLLSNAAIVSRDYQDSWILEGLEVPFAVLMITFLIYFSIEKNIYWLIIFGLIIRLTLLSLPNLKYDWFHGRAIDQQTDYRFSQDIYDQGRIIAGYEDSGTPSMHLSFVIYSFITGLNIIDSFKYLPMLPWIIFPLFTYLLMNKIDPKNDTVKRYAIFISSIPFKPSISYYVMGTLFGPLILFLILYQLAKKPEKNHKDLIIIVVCSFALASMHSFSSIAFIFLLFILYSLMRLVKYKQTFMRPLSSCLIIIGIINLLWYMYSSTVFIMSLKLLSTHIGKSIGIVEKPGIEGFFFERFFVIGLIDQLKVILVYHGADIFILILTIMGLGIIYKKNLIYENFSLMILSLYITSLILFFIFGYIFNIGLQWYDRTIRLFLLSSPIFASISIQHFEAKTRNKMISTFILCIFLIFSTIELYRYEPLIPSASSFSKELSENEPLVYVNLVNTVYQRNMIIYFERYFPYEKNIALDKTTQNQLYGLTSTDFSQSHYYIPLSKVRLFTFDYYLIHLPGKSGGFHEEVEIRTTRMILSTIYNTSYNLIYTNSGSYILSNR